MFVPTSAQRFQRSNKANYLLPLGAQSSKPPKRESCCYTHLCSCLGQSSKVWCDVWGLIRAISCTVGFYYYDNTASNYADRAHWYAWDTLPPGRSLQQTQQWGGKIRANVWIKFRGLFAAVCLLTVLYKKPTGPCVYTEKKCLVVHVWHFTGKGGLTIVVLNVNSSKWHPQY